MKCRCEQWRISFSFLKHPAKKKQEMMNSNINNVLFCYCLLALFLKCTSSHYKPYNILYNPHMHISIAACVPSALRKVHVIIICKLYLKVSVVMLNVFDVSAHISASRLWESIHQLLHIYTVKLCFWRLWICQYKFHVFYFFSSWQIYRSVTNSRK